MSRPVACYSPSPRYLLFVLLAAIGAGLSFWSGLRWSPEGWRALSFLAAGGFAISASAMLLVIGRPRVEIHESQLRIGRREIAWAEVRRLDHSGWLVPLALWITLEGEEHILLVYAGDLDSSASLLRHLRRYSRQALIDGVPYRQFWGEPGKETTAAPARQQSPPRYPLLRPEDEQEVERLFRRLKAAGNLDRQEDRHAPDEKK